MFSVLISITLLRIISLKCVLFHIQTSKLFEISKFQSTKNRVLRTRTQINLNPEMLSNWTCNVLCIEQQIWWPSFTDDEDDRHNQWRNHCCQIAKSSEKHYFYAEDIDSGTAINKISRKYFFLIFLRVN